VGEPALESRGEATMTMLRFQDSGDGPRRPSITTRAFRLLGMVLALGLAALVIASFLPKHPAKDGKNAGSAPSAGSGATQGVADTTTQAAAWQALEAGLDLGVFTSPRPAGIGDSKVRVLRIDPARFEFRLLNASAQPDGKALTARQWCSRSGLAAAINAGMYQQDHKTSTALMKTRSHTNNPRLTADKAMLLFERLSDTVPPVRLADLEFENYPDFAKQYGTQVQSIRMLSSKGRNVWREQAKKHSTAAIGMDGQGRILFIHSRSPYPVHDLVEILLVLPMGLKTCMYVEGGPEAQLYVHSGSVELEAVGSFESGFREDDSNMAAWPVPNVVGIAGRK
jgi:hypothetical protein